MAIYAEYINSVLKNIPESETLSNGNIFKKFNNADIQKSFDDFRELGTNCVIYFPFAVKHDNTYGISSYLHYPESTYATYLTPSTFNEQSGMFTSNNEYHLFESKKKFPHDCDFGTPLDDNAQIVPSDDKDPGFWKSSRMCSNHDFRSMNCKK